MNSAKQAAADIIAVETFRTVAGHIIYQWTRPRPLLLLLMEGDFIGLQQRRQQQQQQQQQQESQ